MRTHLDVSEDILSTTGSRGGAGQQADGEVRRGLDSFAAVLWDMDGTLVDTEPYWIDSEFALIERARRHLEPRARDEPRRQRPARVRAATSPSTPASTSTLADRRGAARPGGRPRRAGGALAARRPRAAAPTCATAACRCALVTMSYRRFVAPILAIAARGHLRGRRHRRHRQPGQAAPGALPARPPRSSACDPRTTLAIEDSNTGARSAEAAGCTVLVVENHVPVAPGERRVFADTLVGLTARRPPGARRGAHRG